MNKDIEEGAGFAEKLTKSPGLLVAADCLKNGYERSRAVPANIQKYAEHSIHDIYTQGLRVGLENALEAGKLSHTKDVVRTFEKLAQAANPKITAGNAVRYYNSHLPNGSFRLNENARLPRDAELGEQDKRLYTAAQNLGFHHARKIIEQLHPYVKDEVVDLTALRQDAAEIYKKARSAARGK